MRTMVIGRERSLVRMTALRLDLRKVPKREIRWEIKKVRRSGARMVTQRASNLVK
jgi:hypothetical protein